MTMKTVKFTEDAVVQIDPTITTSFRTGRIVDLPEKVAAKHIKEGDCEPYEHAQDEGEDDKKLSLEDAIKALKTDDPAHLTKEGKPSLNVLKELTGGSVDKDEAYKLWEARVKAGNNKK